MTRAPVLPAAGRKVRSRNGRARPDASEWVRCLIDEYNFRARRGSVRVGETVGERRNSGEALVNDCIDRDVSGTIDLFRPSDSLLGQTPGALTPVPPPVCRAPAVPLPRAVGLSPSPYA